MATSFRIWQAEPRGDGDVSLQDHHRPASPRPDSARSKDRSQNRLQRTQQDDQPRHADLRPYQIRRKPEGEMQPKRYSCTNATDRDLAVRGVDVQLVADPGFLMTLGIAFGADIAVPRQIFQHRGQGHAELALDPARRLDRTLLALARAAALAFGRCGWLRLGGRYRAFARPVGGAFARG